ncbi:MAG: DUF2062 domain-containing protein [Geminicoccaceae bacterium]
MFRRRNPIPLWQRLRSWLWPRIGWRRSGVYVLKRLARLSGTPHSIAAGFASGAALAFTPFMGFHIILSVLLALLVRGNYVAAAVGTLVGNPWTFPLIWVSTYKLGHLLLGGVELPVAHLSPLTLQTLFSNLHALLWPMTVGSVPMAIVAWFVSYFPLVRLIAAYQHARRRRRERRIAAAPRRFRIRSGNASADPRVG